MNRLLSCSVLASSEPVALCQGNSAGGNRFKSRSRLSCSAEIVMSCAAVAMLLHGVTPLPGVTGIDTWPRRTNGTAQTSNSLQHLH